MFATANAQPAMRSAQDTPNESCQKSPCPGTVRVCWAEDARVSLVAVGKGDKREGALPDRRMGLRAVDVHRQNLAVCLTNSPQIFGILRALCLKHPQISEQNTRLLMREQS